MIDRDPDVTTGLHPDDLCTRPAVVQTAKTFELMRNNAVNARRFPQSFPQRSRKSHRREMVG
jgi:hypothetical protein